MFPASAAQQVRRQRLGFGAQQPRVLQRLVVVVDRTRADDDQQALIFTGQNGFHLAAGIQQVLGDGVG